MRLAVSVPPLATLGPGCTVSAPPPNWTVAKFCAMPGPSVARSTRIVSLKVVFVLKLNGCTLLLVARSIVAVFGPVPTPAAGKAAVLARTSVPALDVAWAKKLFEPLRINTPWPPLFKVPVKLLEIATVPLLGTFTAAEPLTTDEKLTTPLPSPLKFNEPLPLIVPVTPNVLPPLAENAKAPELLTFGVNAKPRVGGRHAERARGRRGNGAAQRQVCAELQKARADQRGPVVIRGRVGEVQSARGNRHAQCPAAWRGVRDRAAVLRRPGGAARVGQRGTAAASGDQLRSKAGQAADLLVVAGQV